MRGLYAIVDVAVLEARGIDPVKFAMALLGARPVALQVRAKDLPARDILALLRRMVPMCRSTGTWLFANDRPDVAALSGCDGVHIGQDDLAIDRVRRIAPHLRIGMSTHTPSQLAVALEARPDYVAYGPVFATTSKKNADTVVGLEQLRAAGIAALVARIPLVAIGGISLERAPAVALCAPVAAVIGGLVPDGPLGARLEEVTVRARAYQSALDVATPAFEARP